MNFNNLTTPSCPSQYSVHPQENIVTNKYSFFYAPSNDFQLYHIFCEETPLTFELVSRLINNADNNLIHNYSRFDNTYVFYHQQPEIKKIYRVTCEMISHTFIFQFLNKIIYGNYSFQYEYEQQEFSKRHQENLKFHLKKDLIHYLTSKPTYEQESDLFKKFIQDYYVYESMINPDSTQMSNPQNDKGNYNQDYCGNNNYFNNYFQ